MSLQTMPAPTRTRHPHALTPDDMAKLLADGVVAVTGSNEIENRKVMATKGRIRRDWSEMDNWEIGETRHWPYEGGRDATRMRSFVFAAALARRYRITTSADHVGIHATRIS